jgi:hypothetical protein
MLRFWTWAGTIAATILGGVAVYLIAQRPQETVDVVSKFLEQILYLRQQPWFRDAAVFLGGLISGLCLDWLRRKLGRSRADMREALGNEMLILDHDLLGLRDPMSEARSEIMSCFITARKFKIWAPDERVFEIQPNRAYDMIRNYLTNVGVMLRDGHFSEAKRYAMRIKAALALAYREHGLST